MCGPTGVDTGREGLCATHQRPWKAFIIEEVLGDQAERATQLRQQLASVTDLLRFGTVGSRVELTWQERGSAFTENDLGTSPGVHWLVIHLAMQRIWVQSPVGELISHMLWKNEACVPQLESYVPQAKIPPVMNKGSTRCK